ncbi:toll-like receptor 4 [Mytilus galloprovincialis]|uniref:toll-like receptor 4 n=1 Tax=Mytilus galloprovincialis TaxID=29158 RepID=UPI003F7BD98D
MMLSFYILFLVFGIPWTSPTTIKSQNGFTPCEFYPDCQCNKDNESSLYIADCSGLNMTQIRKFPNIIVKLTLRMNSLNEVKNGTFFENRLLRTLDLSFNSINTLWPSSFIGLEQLTELDLQQNSLSRKSLTYSVFASFQSLVYLNLKGNFYQEFQPNISSLVRLKTLKMDFAYKETTILGKQLSNLKRLMRLDLSGFTGNCSIIHLTPQTFQYLPQIHHLNLSMCKIKSVQKGTFDKMKNIISLDLSGNTCLKFQVLENVTIDLQFSAIKILKLNKIHKVFDMNTYLQTSHIRHLNNTAIEEFHLDSNRLQQIESGALKYFPKTLKYVSTRDNMFSIGPYLYDLMSMSIELFDISDMFKAHKEDRHPETCNMNFVCTWHREAQYNENQNIQMKELLFESGQHYHDDNAVTIIPIPYRLKTLRFRSSDSKYKIAAVTLSNNKLERIDVSNNILSQLIGPLKNTKNLKYLNLSSNVCSNISTFFFSPDFNKLEELLLGNNLLGLVLPSDTFGQIFQNLLNLKKLDLSENRISILPNQIFKSQRKLEILDLSSNFLEKIDFKLSHLSHLSYLNLRNNLLTFIDSHTILGINHIVNMSKNLSINLLENRLVCTCSSESFIKWIGSTSVQLVNKYHTFCQLSTGKRILMINIPEIYKRLEKDCTSYEVLISVLVVTILLFFIVLILGFSYRFRWKLRYFYYMVKIRSRSKIPQIDEDENEYMYDAFVSYADEDRLFIHTQLLQTLEKENGIRLCLHKRNFLPGNDIATNITSAIHNSRKTIVIMTYHYLKSYWCMFEFNMARMESIYERNNENVLFLVVFEQISARDFPLHILEVVQSQSYIEFPNDEQGDVVFWLQLVTALK